ncbi:hypothetical protein ACTMTI_21190 [Nonomuraea sp. H19]|uniref:hypothetical protein n=1 Tax=Nonomuraea sp. H19 TaxID=3452206 RepID=UPI003F8C6BA6
MRNPWPIRCCRHPDGTVASGMRTGSMQFIETSVIGTRSAILTFRRPGTPLTFLLVPMVHIAEHAFFEQALDRLRTCDLIVAEGEPAAAIRAHRKLYRLRLGRLVHQVTVFDVESLGVPVLWPDRREDAGPPGWFDAVIDVLTAIPDWLGVVKRFPGHGLEVTDLTGHDGWAGGRLRRGWWKLILTERDEDLLACITRIHEERGDEPITVAVPWGAAHMIAVSHHLFAELGYRVVGAEWLTVRNAR